MTFNVYNISVDSRTYSLQIREMTCRTFKQCNQDHTYDNISQI